jgi:hypothetical protein
MYAPHKSRQNGNTPPLSFLIIIIKKKKAQSFMIIFLTDDSACIGYRVRKKENAKQKGQKASFSPR